ncbi:MAG: S9 family peptidase [Anaerolineales bacterium]|nr:S9 family peptidase [Anaerolineales bacterium]
MPETSFLDQLLGLPTVIRALLSPDGRWVAFMWYHMHENIDVFLVPSDGSAPPVALCHTPEYTELVSWRPDSRAVILAEDRDGDERNHLFQVEFWADPDGSLSIGEALPLTEKHPPYFLRGGQVSPDGRALYYGANYDFAAGQTIEPTWIYRHDLQTGQRAPIARPERPAYTTVELNRAGAHLLYARKDRHPSGRQFYLVDVLGERDEEILHFGEQVKIFARWLPDSEHILVISESTQRGGVVQGYNGLGIYHWPTGTLRWLIDDPQRTIEGAWVSPDGAIVVDEVKDANHIPTFFAPEEGGWNLDSDAAPLERPFPRPKGNLVPIGRAADGAWIALYYASNSPTELVRFTLEQGTPAGPASETRFVSLTRVWERSELDPKRLAAAEPFHWNSDDGLRVQGWLYRAQPNPRKAVLAIHGGPSHHSEDELNPEIQYLVSRGFNVLDVNYRGSTGFGLKFRELIKEDGWGGREQADIAAGASALIQAGLAEAGKVGVTGTSYGGYSSWHQITHTPPQVIGAAAPICGMTDLVVDYETTRPDLRPYSEEMIGGSPEQAPERYYERSPINFVEQVRGKLLIVQGAQDPNVTPENVRQVRQRLDEQHIPYELLVFEDEGHGIARPANQKVLYARLADFFDKAFS